MERRSKRDGNDVQQSGGFVDSVQKNLFYTRRPSSVTGPGFSLWDFSGFGVFEILDTITRAI